ncbi:MAG: TonB family protein [Opitutaceae bacterium]|nr:TonB family protein [Opitutaceae bacterium]
MLSLTLHGAIVALVLFFTFAMHTQVKEQPKIFELVAGEGDNYMATEAPALGTPGIKLNVPTPPAPVVKPAPEPEPAPPEPVIERAPEKPAPKAAVKPVETKTPNYTKDVLRIASKREKRLVEADRKKREAEAKRISKAEFDKLNKSKTQPKGGAVNPKVARIDAEGIAKGVVGGSVNNKTGGAGGKALSRAEQSALDSYIALLLQRLRAAHEKPSGLSDLLEAEVEFRIAADGTLSGVKIVRSSGSSEFDRSVLEAFARVRSIGPTPNNKSDVWVVTFKMKEEE